MLEFKTKVKTKLWEGQKMWNIYDYEQIYVYVLTVKLDDLFVWTEASLFYHKTYLKEAELQFPVYLSKTQLSFEKEANFSIRQFLRGGQLS